MRCTGEPPNPPHNTYGASATHRSQVQACRNSQTPRVVPAFGKLVAGVGMQYKVEELGYSRKLGTLRGKVCDHPKGEEVVKEGFLEEVGEGLQLRKE